MDHPPERPGVGRRMMAVVAFLGAFAIILILVVDRFLLPAMRAAQGADRTAQRHLSALSSLVLVIVLMCLLVLLIVAFRPGRMFLPRKWRPKSRTLYEDAWEESARRMQTPPREDEDE